MKQLVLQCLKFASAVSKCWAYICFLVSASAKKNAEAIEFLGILQKYYSKNKKIYIFVKKEMFHLIIKLFLFLTQFSNLISWRRSFTVLFTDVCILSLYFCCSLISASKKGDLPYSYIWKNFKKMNEKMKSRGVWALNM